MSEEVRMHVSNRDKDMELLAGENIGLRRQLAAKDDEIAQLRGDCDHWAADYTELQVTLGRYIAERDSARALLREVANRLNTHHDLRARIAAELEK